MWTATAERILTKAASPYFANLLADPALHGVFSGLRASPEALADRSQHDTTCLDTAARLAENFLEPKVLAIPGVRVVDTTSLRLDDIVERIIESEAPDLGPGWVTGGQPGSGT